MPGPYDALKKAQGIGPGQPESAELFTQALEILAGAMGVSSVPTPFGTMDTPENPSRAARFGELLSAASPLAALGGSSKAKALMQQLGAPPRGIRAYHGSPHDFDKFDVSKAGATTDEGQLGRGLYFSTDPRVAEAFPHKYEANVHLQQPLTLDMDDLGRLDKRPLMRQALSLPPDADAAAITSALRARGHDGVVLDYAPTGYAHREVMALDDSIIDILRKYGIVLPAGGGATLAAVLQQLSGTETKQ